MKLKANLKILLLLISVFVSSGCALVSPFESLDNGCNEFTESCSTVTENLEQAQAKKQPVTTPITETTTTDNVSVVYNDKDVEKAEIARQLLEQSIDSSMTAQPTKIHPSTYKVYILPYVDKDEFYSARYIYITAGKPKWITGNIVVTSNGNLSVDVPKAEYKLDKSKYINAIIKNFTAEKPIIKHKPVKHRVNTHQLNCRKQADFNSEILAVFNRDEVLDVINKDTDWWLINYFDMECFVNSSHLYSEPVQ